MEQTLEGGEKHLAAAEGALPRGAAGVRVPRALARPRARPLRHGSRGARRRGAGGSAGRAWCSSTPSGIPTLDGGSRRGAAREDRRVPPRAGGAARDRRDVPPPRGGLGRHARAAAREQPAAAQGRPRRARARTGRPGPASRRRRPAPARPRPRTANAVRAAVRPGAALRSSAVRRARAPHRGSPSSGGRRSPQRVRAPRPKPGRALRAASGAGVAAAAGAAVRAPDRAVRRRARLRRPRARSHELRPDRGPEAHSRRGARLRRGRDRARASPSWEKEERFPREILERLGAMGVLGMMVPEEYGGAGADALSYVLGGRGARARLRLDGRHRLGQQLGRLLPDLEVRHRGAEDDDPEAELASGHGARRLRADRAAVRLRRGEPEDARRARRGRLRA